MNYTVTIRTGLKLGVLALFTICWSCDGPTAEQTTTSSEEATVTKRTQALLLTQNFSFDENQIDTVSGPYLAQNRLVIPPNLAPQNKWIMFEGPVLENDVIAYRFYADSRHRFDIYAKSVPDLVMDTVSWNYHDIMNWGSDVLKVENSLGIGSPAIWYQDSLYTLSDSDEKVIEIIENGDEAALIRTTFKGLAIGSEKFDLIQDWHIEAGEAWSTIQLEVVNGSLPEGMFFATGIVKHLPEVTTGTAGNAFYAYTWGNQSFHHENLGMGIVAPQASQPEAVTDDLSHAYLFRQPRQKVAYAFLAAWERGNSGVKDDAGMKKLIEEAAGDW